MPSNWNSSGYQPRSRCSIVGRRSAFGWPTDRTANRLTRSPANAGERPAHRGAPVVRDHVRALDLQRIEHREHVRDAVPHAVGAGRPRAGRSRRSRAGPGRSRGSRRRPAPGPGGATGTTSRGSRGSAAPARPPPRRRPRARRRRPASRRIEADPSPRAPPSPRRRGPRRARREVGELRRLEALKRGQRVASLRFAPAQVLDDPLGVDDHLAAELEHRHPPLAGQLVDLVAVARAPRHAHRLRLDPARRQLAGHPPARAQPVRRRPAAVQPRRRSRHELLEPPQRVPGRPPAQRLPACPVRASRPASRSRYQATVASTVSSCGRVVHPSSRRALVER